MSSTGLLAVQTVLVFFQIVNASIGTTIHNPLATLLLGAAVGAGQFFIQNVGNKTVPPPPSTKM